MAAIFLDRDREKRGRKLTKFQTMGIGGLPPDSGTQQRVGRSKLLNQSLTHTSKEAVSEPQCFVPPGPWQLSGGKGMYRLVDKDSFLGNF